MLAAQVTTRPQTLEELMPPALAARLDALDLHSRRVLAGKLPGERRSKRRGRSVEFDDFRDYAAGDDLRHIDWNVYARLDRLFIKLFREEEDLGLLLIVDCSASMDAGQPSKLVFAHQVAMALGYVGLVNHNRVSCAVFGAPRDRRVRQLAPMRGRTGVQRLAAFLLESVSGKPRAGDDASAAPADSAPTRAVAFAEAMRAVAATRATRGVVVLLSDFLLPEGPEAGLDYLAASTGGMGMDAYALHVLSPGELDPARDEERGLVGDLRLTDAESNAGADVTISPALLARYRANLNQFLARTTRACHARGLAYFLTPSDTAPERLVLDSLRRGGMLR